MGKQTGTDIWGLNREVQVNGIGNWIDLADSNFIWQPVGGPCIKTSMGKGSIALDLEGRDYASPPVREFPPPATHNNASSAEAQLHCW